MRPDADKMLSAGRFTIPADHASLAGHFPGRPVVPGVVMLDHAAWLIGRGLPGRLPGGLRQVKFLAAVLPGQEIEARYSLGADGDAAFACLRDGHAVVTGVLVLHPAAS